MVTRDLEEHAMRSRLRSSIVAVGAWCLVALVAPPVRAVTVSAPGAVARPDGRGDQVISYYDARDGFTSFLNLRNETGTALSVSLLLYDSAFDPPFAQTLTIDAGSLATIDMSALRAGGLRAGVGVAFATAVNAAGAPIVSRALAGNFTVANLATVIDGSNILLPPIQPSNADLASYYDPDLLVRSGGNDQLIFIAFEDVPGPVYSARTASVPWTLQALDATGQQAAITTFTATGVTATDLVTVAGSGINGASGAITFITTGTTAPLTRLIYFTESLGTFSSGYLLPRAGRS
jgi:hypothetical protein